MVKNLPVRTIKKNLIINKDKLKAVENTFDTYSDSKFEQKNKVSDQRKKANSELNDEIDKLISSGGTSQKKSLVKKIAFEIESIDDLSPELQKNIKKLMNGVSKDEVNKLINEIENEKEKLFSDKGVFGKMSSGEKATLEKKLEEYEVPKEILEVNVSAILSCLNNLVID
jgi:hypothetical protein